MPLTKVITWNGASSEDIDGLVISEIARDPIGRIRTAQVDVPGMEGSWIFTQAKGMKRFIAQAHIERDSKENLRLSQTELNTWLDVEGEAKWQTDDDPGIYYKGYLLSADELSAWRWLATYELQWMLQPYAYDNNIETESWTSDTNDDHTWNPGLEVAVYPTVQITPTNGTLTSFTLFSERNILYFGEEILSGHSITINSQASIVLQGTDGDSELTGAYDPSDALMSTVDGDFPVLVPPSDNTITFLKTGGTATSFDIVVKYRKRYRR